MKTHAPVLLASLTVAAAAAELPDISPVPADLVLPAMETAAPAPGRRVRQVTPGWETTEAHHALYLPVNWTPGARHPVIAEYAGNGGYSNRFGDISGGTVEGCMMGYGLSGGSNFIWVCLPFVEVTNGTKRNTARWWGDADETARYAAATMRHLCREFGGDERALVLCGFSRGALACNYIGLRDDTIAPLWRAFLCHSHYDGVRTWAYAGSDRPSALARLRRLDGRPQWISQEGSTAATRAFLEGSGVTAPWTFVDFPYRNHTAAWALRDCEFRRTARAWLAEVLGAPGGTRKTEDGKRKDGNGAAVRDAVRDVLVPSPPGALRVAGRVGAEIDKVAGARILSEKAAAEIYPEAIEAFRARVDDRMRPGQGLWQGEFWGKWVLSAVAAQQYTGDAALQARIAKAVDDLLATQRDDGYIGTYHDSAFVKPADAKKNNWNVWCRKYTLWGLLEAGELTGHPGALPAARRFTDHLMTEVGPGATDILDTGKFAGMPSSSILTPLLMLYRRTGDARYLDYARYIVRQWGSRPGQPPDILAKGLEGKPVDEWFPDPETWTKAYEFISCVEGLVELHRITGEPDVLRAAVNIHRVLREHERTVFGGIGKNDKLRKAARLQDTEAEVCDAIYWNRLSAQLLRLTGEAVYADEIERTLYNVLLGAMNADGSWGVRRLCLSGAHWPAPPHCDLKTHHCCVDNMPRGLLQIPEVAVMTGPGPDAVTVNLYLPGETRRNLVLSCGAEVGLRIHNPDFDHERVAIEVWTDKPAAFALRLRVPPWSVSPAIQDGVAPAKPVAPGTYAEVRHTWDGLHCVFLDPGVRARLVDFPGNGIGTNAGRRVAVMRGPVVLARDIRLGQPAIHEPVAFAPDADGCVACTPVAPPAGMWRAFDIATAGGGTIRMCDYASAGQTWTNATSDFRVWLPQTP